MKKLALLAIFCMMLVACGGETQSDTTNPADDPAAGNSSETPSDDPAADASGDDSSNTETPGASTAMGSFGSIDELKGRFDWQEGTSGVLYYDVIVGSGRTVEKGDWIAAFYTLWDADGNQLQSNTNDQPFVIKVGVGQLIPGWDALVPGMKDGGVRRLIVPGDMAYGASPPPGSGIEANATLVFELEMVASGTPGAARR